VRNRVLGRSDQREAQPDGVEENRPTRGIRLRAFANRLLRLSDRGSEAAQQAGPEGEQLPSYGPASAQGQAGLDRAAIEGLADAQGQAELNRVALEKAAKETKEAEFSGHLRLAPLPTTRIGVPKP
jgi:hypothetical protein